MLILVVLGITYWTVISEGLRFLIPVLGQRLSKLPIPGLSFLARYQATYRLDLANTMSVFLFLAMWSLWGMILKTYLGSDEHFHRQGWSPDRYRTLVMVLGKLRHEWFYCANEAVARAGAADLGDSNYKDKLMVLARGVRMVKENRQVFQEYVKPLENLWHFPGLGEQKAKEALRRIRTRREYQDGKLSTGESESDAESTRAESRTSSTCSAADRLRTSASEGSGRKES